MRVIVLAGAIVGLAGCGVIPPAVSLVTWALDGTSLAFSGKTITDHALSSLARKDCAIWRVVRRKAICVDWPQEDNTILVASIEPSVSWVGEGAGNTLAAAPADAPELGSPAPAALPEEPTLLAQGFADIAPAAGAPFDYDGVIDLALPPSEPVVVATAETETDVMGAGPVTDAADGDKPLVLAMAWPEVAKAMRYVVIGSFHRTANAEDLALRHRDLHPFIVEATVNGRLYRRVVVGPFPKSDLKAAIRLIRQAGIEGAWVLPTGPMPRPIEVAMLAGAD